MVLGQHFRLSCLLISLEHHLKFTIAPLLEICTTTFCSRNRFWKVSFGSIITIIMKALSTSSSVAGVKVYLPSAIGLLGQVVYCYVCVCLNITVNCSDLSTQRAKTERAQLWFCLLKKHSKRLCLQVHWGFAVLAFECCNISCKVTVFVFGEWPLGSPPPSDAPRPDSVLEMWQKILNLNPL